MKHVYTCTGTYVDYRGDTRWRLKRDDGAIEDVAVIQLKQHLHAHRISNPEVTAVPGVKRSS